jgi:hypothetical protein
MWDIAADARIPSERDAVTVYNDNGDGGRAEFVKVSHRHFVYGPDGNLDTVTLTCAPLPSKVT